MLRIPRDQFTYAFSAATTPVATISPGDQFVVETHDTSTGRIHRAEDVPEFVRVRDPLKVNPAAGPVFIDGATPTEIALAAAQAGKHILCEKPLATTVEEAQAVVDAAARQSAGEADAAGFCNTL